MNDKVKKALSELYEEGTLAYSSEAQIEALMDPEKFEDSDVFMALQCFHRDSITQENLHSKSDIVNELARRDTAIWILSNQLTKMANLLVEKNTELTVMKMLVE